MLLVAYWSFTGATTWAAHAEAISFKIGHGSIIESGWSKISFNFYHVSACKGAHAAISKLKV